MKLANLSLLLPFLAFASCGAPGTPVPNSAPTARAEGVETAASSTPALESSPPRGDEELTRWTDRVYAIALADYRRGDYTAVSDRVNPALDELIDRTQQGGSRAESYALNRLRGFAGSTRSIELAGRAFRRHSWIEQHGPTPVDPKLEAEIVLEPSVVPGAPGDDGSSSEAIAILLERAGEQIARGDLAAAESTLAKLEADDLRAPDADGSTRLRTRELRAKLLLAQRHIAEAQRLLQEVFDELASQDPTDVAALVRVGESLASAYKELEDYEGARSVEERVLAKRGQTSGAGDADTRELRSHAVTLLAMGDLAGVRAFEERILASASADADTKPSDVDDARASLAATFRAQGEFQSALDLEQLTLAEARRSRADARSVRAQQLRVGELSLRTGDFAAARTLFEAVLASASPDEFDFETVQVWLAEALAGLGELGEARALLESVLRARELRLPVGHPDRVATRRLLARVCADQRDFERSRDLQQGVIDELVARDLPSDHSDMLDARRDLAATLERLGDPGAAREMRNGVEATQATAAWSRLPASIRAEALRADEAVRECRFEDAITGRRRIVDECRQLQPAEEAATSEALRELAALLRVTGDRDGSRAIEDELVSRTPPAGKGFETSGRPVEASARTATDKRYLPEVTIKSIPKTLDRRFEVHATLSSLSGISAVHVRQDGIALPRRPKLEEWKMDPSGVTGQVRLALVIPADRDNSVVSIIAEDRRGVQSSAATIVARP